MKQTRMYMIGTFVVLCGCFGVTSSAAASCGDVVYPEGFFDEGSLEERTPIENCDDPFGETIEPVTGVTYLLGTTTISEGSEILLAELPVTVELETNVEHSPKSATVLTDVYHLVEGDYYFVQPDAHELTITATGTYVLVTTINELIFSERPSWLESLWSILLPQLAHAQSQEFISPEIHVTTFMVSLPPPPEPEATGASSVLFLPGLQASRLYLEDGDGDENRIWEPNIDADVEKLAMTENGSSVYQVYKKDVLDEVYGVDNVYKGFLKHLHNLQDDKVIKAYYPFAYDWRYDVFDVATRPVRLKDNQTQSLVNKVLDLAEESYTGKVTIVAHSNGGLVAKALLHEFGESELANKVDKLIMVGTPQLGTPKAIGSLLHGLDQGTPLGLIINRATVREVSRNMPGAYALLPSAKYFELATDVVVTTDGSEMAQSIAAYGDIQTAAALRSFLLDDKDRLDDAVTINDPLTLNPLMVESAIASHNILDNWVAPEGVEVYEVVGTGLPTVKGLEYREFSCNTNPFCTIKPFMKPIPLETNQGDQTVVAISASGYRDNKITAYIDLKADGEGLTRSNREHKDLTDSKTVQDFITSVLKYPYLADSIHVPEFTEVSTSYTIIGGHSPITLTATDNQGNQVGIVDGEVRQDITGSQYFEFAGSKYLVIPNGVDYTV
ncbi:hypothetical protein KC906_03665, partial [Candidatus Kaiserbacteria bacterium]|nr:hypothetical protein [Candidatus Kaiserbacteria bacterium]